MSKLNTHTKQALEKIVIDAYMTSMFGDGQEKEYVMNGIRHKGVYHLTEEELVDEARCFCFEEESDLIQEAEAQLAIDDMLALPISTITQVKDFLNEMYGQCTKAYILTEEEYADYILLEDQ